MSTAEEMESTSNKKKDVYGCDQCDYKTSDFMAFIGHKNEHTEKQKQRSLFTCGMCTYVTPFPDAMTKHIIAHTRGDPIIVKDEPHFDDDIANDPTAKAKTPTHSSVMVKGLPADESMEAGRPTSENEALHLAIKEVRSVSSNSGESFNSMHASNIDLTAVASEALIGCLEPRRAKKSQLQEPKPPETPSGPSIQKPVDDIGQGAAETTDRTQNDSGRSLMKNPSDVLNMPEHPQKQVKLLKYSPHGQFAVKCFRDKGRIIATAKNCPTIEPTDTSVATTNSDSEPMLAPDLTVIGRSVKLHEPQPSTDFDTALIPVGDESSSKEADNINVPNESTSSEQISKTYRKPKKDILNRYKNEQQLHHQSCPVPSENTVIAEPKEPLGCGDDNKSDQNDTICSKVKDLMSDTYHVTVSYQRGNGLGQSRSKKAQTSKKSKKKDSIKVSASTSVKHDDESHKYANLKSSFQHCFKKMRMSNGIALSTDRKASEPTRKSAGASKRAAVQPRTYGCKLCPYQAGSRASLSAHKEEEHTSEDEMYACEFCDYVASRQSKLETHLKSHKSEDNTESKAKEHKAKEVEVKKPKAKIPKAKASKVESESRQATYLTKICKVSLPITDIGQYTCAFCPFTAKKRSNILVHEGSHLGTQYKFLCQQCPFKTRLFNQYGLHQAVDHKPTTGFILCHGCDFKCQDRKQLKTHHLSVHINRPVFPCNHCEYVAKFAPNLSKHLATEHSIYEETIPAAQQKPSSKARIHRWGRDIGANRKPVIHTDRKPFKCVICEFSASNSVALQKHMPTHAKLHFKKHKCHRCEFSTKFPSMLTRHVRHSCKLRKR